MREKDLPETGNNIPSVVLISNNDNFFEDSETDG
jgi:hypothetical protein